METEIIDRRSLCSKVFDNHDGTFRIHSNVTSPLHYQEAGDWQDVDLTIISIAGGWRMDKSVYTVEISDSDIALTYTSRQGGSGTIRLEAIDDVLVEDLPQFQINASVSGQDVVYANVVPGLELHLTVGPGGIEWFKTLKNASAPRKFRWAIDVDEDREFRIQEITIGRDSMPTEPTGPRNRRNPRRVEIVNQTSAKVVQNGRERFTISEEWTGRVSDVVDPGSRQRNWKNNPVFPVIIDANFTENIVTGADDVYTVGTSFVTHYPGLIYMGIRASNELHVGVRFQSLPLPVGSTIDAATLTVKSSANRSGDTKIKLFGIEEGDAPSWADTSGNRPGDATPRTTAFLQVNTLATGTHTLNIQSVVQEIIDDASSPAWASGNDMRMAFINTRAADSSNYDQAIEDFTHAGTAEAQLDVTYTAPAAGGGPRAGPLGHPLHGALGGPIG